nr:hypothetical protein [uncultured Prevotella sp.]
MEVCPLSCWMMLSVPHVASAQSVSVPLQNGIRFFHNLIPTYPLRSAYPLWEMYRLTEFHVDAKPMG